jgi:hypothetical protein
MGAPDLFGDVANFFGKMQHGTERVSDFVRHHVNKPLLLLLSLLRFSCGTLLRELGLLDLGDVHDGTDKTGVWVVTQRPEQEQPPLPLFACWRCRASEFTPEFFSAGKCFPVRGHDTLVVVRVDAFRPGAELVLDLIRRELEEAIIHEYGLGFGVEDCESVGQQLREALEKLRLHRVDLLGADIFARLLSLRRLDLSARAILRQLVEALYGHVPVDGGVAEELGQHALARAGGVEQSADQELGVAVLLGQVLEEEAGGWRMSGWGAVEQTASDAYLP